MFFFLILRIDSHSIIRNDIESRRKSDIKNKRPTKRAKEKYAHQPTYTSQADPKCVGTLLVKSIRLSIATCRWHMV